MTLIVSTAISIAINAIMYYVSIINNLFIVIFPCFIALAFPLAKLYPAKGDGSGQLALIILTSIAANIIFWSITIYLMIKYARKHTLF
jgi:hypothetical protein